MLARLKIANYFSLYFKINGRTVFEQELNKYPCSLIFVQDNNFVTNYMNFDLVVNALGVQSGRQTDEITDRLKLKERLTSLGRSRS